MSAGRTFQCMHWITKRNMTIRNRLLSTFSHGSPACGVTASACLNVTPNYPLERAIRITLIIFHSPQHEYHWPSARGQDHDSLSTSATHHSPRRVPDAINPVVVVVVAADRTGLVVWMLVAGYTCAERHSTDESWFARYLLGIFGLPDHPRDCGKKTPVNDPEAWVVSFPLEELLGAYLYHPTVQRPRLQGLLDRVCGGWVPSFL